MTPEQASVLNAEVEAATSQAETLTAGMSAEDLMRAPAGGGWGVGESLQHLILTSAAMLPLAETAIAELEANGLKASGPTGLGFVGWLLVKTLEPPARMKTKTGKPFEPVAVANPGELVARLREENTKLAALIKRASGLATHKTRIVSPFNASAKYNVYAGFRIMLAHTRRHLWQAGQVKAGAPRT